MEQLGEGVPSEPPKLMDRVRGKLRVLHLVKRTEEAYVGWIVRFISVHRDRAGRWVHPENMSGAEVSEFPTHLAVFGKYLQAPKIKLFLNCCSCIHKYSVSS